jgi:hypothetical protein
LVTLAFDEEDADAAAFLSQELPDCEAKSWAEVANKLVYVGSPFTVLQACAALEYERVNSTQSLNSFNRTLKANKKMLPQPNWYPPSAYCIATVLATPDVERVTYHVCCGPPGKSQRGIREFARSDMPLQQVETAKALATAAAKALDLTKKPAEVR